MKNLTRIFFCTFAVASFYSCEPEDLDLSSKYESDFEIYSSNGEQESVIEDDK